MSYRIPAVYMRGGTSKGVVFRAEDLPVDPGTRDRLLRRVIGSPDPYGKQTDGMGGATSSTSKVVIINASRIDGYDVDYLFGQVSIDKSMIDWSGNCGNLSAAVGPFAISQGLVAPGGDGFATVRIWQVNTRSRIVAQVPVESGCVVEQGTFMLDGVPAPSAEIRLDFFGPEGDDSPSPGIFPTGAVRTRLMVPGAGDFDATLIRAGNPTVFLHARELGLYGNESPSELRASAGLLARCELIRAHAAVAMGLAATADDATNLRPHTPKLALVSESLPFSASDGRAVSVEEIDLNVRIFSMGMPHHAMTGTGAIAIAVAAAVPGTIVSSVPGHRAERVPLAGLQQVRFGHPSGVTEIAAQVQERDGSWRMVKTRISSSSRRLMEGWVVVPEHPGT